MTMKTELNSSSKSISDLKQLSTKLTTEDDFDFDVDIGFDVVDFDVDVDVNDLDVDIFAGAVYRLDDSGQVVNALKDLRVGAEEDIQQLLHLRESLLALIGS